MTPYLYTIHKYDRCDELQASLAAINKGLPANTSMLVQREELQRTLAAATDSLGRQQASCMKVLAGLEGRMEALSENTAKQDDVVTKVGVLLAGSHMQGRNHTAWFIRSLTSLCVHDVLRSVHCS